jgi:hypothetical protein
MIYLKKMEIRMHPTSRTAIASTAAAVIRAHHLLAHSIIAVMRFLFGLYMPEPQLICGARHKGVRRLLLHFGKHTIKQLASYAGSELFVNRLYFGTEGLWISYLVDFHPLLFDCVN